MQFCACVCFTCSVNSNYMVNFMYSWHVSVFTKGLSQILGLCWLYFCAKVKPKTWL